MSFRKLFGMVKEVIGNILNTCTHSLQLHVKSCAPREVPKVLHMWHKKRVQTSTNSALGFGVRESDLTWDRSVFVSLVI